MRRSDSNFRDEAIFARRPGDPFAEGRPSSTATAEVPGAHEEGILSAIRECGSRLILHALLRRIIRRSGRAGQGSDGIERLQAYLTELAFSPHGHDTYAIGVTLSGGQRFRYRGEQRYCLPGHSCRQGSPGGRRRSTAWARMLRKPPKRAALDLGGGKLLVGFKPEAYSAALTRN